MAFLLLLLLTVCFIQESSAEDCYNEVSTESLVQSIRYTGNACSWIIIAPESQRIVLNLEKFIIQTENEGCDTYLEIFDESSTARPICRNLTRGNNYISHGNTLHLNLINKSDVPSIATMEVTFRAAEEYFFCDFSRSSQCTQEVEQISSWVYTENERGICGRQSFGQPSRSGIFYQPSFSSTNLLIAPLPSGEYILDADVFAGCSQLILTQNISLTFCNRTKQYPLLGYYQRWATGTDLIQCDHESEALIQVTLGNMVVAIDSIRLWKLTDKLPGQSTVPSTTIPSTTVPSTTIPSTRSSSTSPLPTHDHGEQSVDVGSQSVPLILGVAGTIVLIIVVLLVCTLYWKRKKTMKGSQDDQVSVDFDNRTYETSISSLAPVADPPPEYAVINKVRQTGVPLSPNPAYQSVDGNVVTAEEYSYIDTNPSLGYESTGVKDNEYALQITEHENPTYNALPDQVGSPENEYQLLNQPPSAKA